MHPLNLVIDVKGLNAGSAARWIAERFQVPAVPKHAPARRTLRVPTTVGIGGALKPLVVSGLYAQMSKAAKNVAVVLAELCNKDQALPIYDVRVSYRGILRYSGMKSQNAVRKGLREELRSQQRQKRISGAAPPLIT
jgi:hypothetical protein